MVRSPAPRAISAAVLSALTVGTATNQSGGTVNATTGVFSGTLTPSQTSGIVGTTTNNNANAGSVGESIVSAVAGVSFPASGTYGDGASIVLTAGDWDIDLVGWITANGATVVSWNLGISTTTGNSATGLTNGDNLLSTLIPPVATANASATISAWRLSIAAGITVFIKLQASFSIATPTFSGRISARRRR